jgi:hypothetical protein
MFAHAATALLGEDLTGPFHGRGLRRAARALLGDGHITQLARGQRFRLTLDAKYPGIVADAGALLARVLPENKVSRVERHGEHMVTVQAYHGHWSWLPPQHGPGKKGTSARSGSNPGNARPCPKRRGPSFAAASAPTAASSSTARARTRTSRTTSATLR